MQLHGLPQGEFVRLYQLQALDLSAAEITALWTVVAAYRARFRAEEERLDLDALNCAIDAPMARHTAAQHALLTTPAPDADALIFKIHLLDENGFGVAFGEELASDVRRLVGRA